MPITCNRGQALLHYSSVHNRSCVEAILKLLRRLRYEYVLLFSLIVCSCLYFEVIFSVVDKYEVCVDWLVLKNIPSSARLFCNSQFESFEVTFTE